MRTIAQRELRNNISRILREVEQGERMRITVDGRPVAELIPVSGARRTFVPRDDILKLLSTAPLDAGFMDDVDSVIGSTIDEL